MDQEGSSAYPGINQTFLGEAEVSKAYREASNFNKFLFCQRSCACAWLLSPETTQANAANSLAAKTAVSNTGAAKSFLNSQEVLEKSPNQPGRAAAICVTQNVITGIHQNRLTI